ncbi:MAG: homoserine dehydrogenase, partial [Armatimonadetes bacterium]|nr:homoserine dehydrogenase [Armatimonadota bacterium]
MLFSAWHQKGNLTPVRQSAVRVGFLGYGTVGVGAVSMLTDNRDAINRKAGLSIEIAKIGIRDSQKPRNLDSKLFTTNLESVVNDPNIDVIVEVIGGIEPAFSLLKAALASGKSVVSANKELIAKHGSELLHLAASKDVDLHFEAAVGGGIPLIQPLKHQLAGNDVLRMMGILNGTTNYILSKMSDEGVEFDDVLKEAQDKGYAEADPTNDVDAFDTTYKIAILASLAFGKQVDSTKILREGIRSVSAEDIRYADRFGFKIKLLG